MSKRDYYEVLGVEKTATPEEIKKAYRKKAKEFHPDSYTGADKKQAEEKFKEASEAYGVLSDETKKTQYDRFGHNFENVGGYGAGGFDGFSGFSSSGMGFDIDLDDILGSVFGGAFSSKKKSGPSKGTDLRYNMTLTFEEAVFGITKEISITRNEACNSCNGTGSKRGSSEVNCSACNGTGKVKMTQNTIMGSFATVRTCEKCNGEGKINPNPCESCSGRGTIKKTRKLEITIPQGIDNGQAISLRGEGDVGKKGGPNGDLFVVVTVAPHKIFKRQGNDIFLDIKIPFVKAVLGGRIQIPTLEGNYEFAIPEGTTPGTAFNIKNKGVPNIRGNGRGDLRFNVEIDIPKKLTDRQRELLREFAEASSDDVNTKKKGFWDKK